MYEPGTILELKEPRSTEDELFAYDQVEVVGVSPISHASIESEWTGTANQGIIIKPLTEFGSTEDEPFGKLQSLYKVVYTPEKFLPRHQDIRVVDTSSAAAGETPEEVFAAAPTESVKPARKKASPLGD